MKLDAKQKKLINELVFSNVKYNETYLEVMDHVISSIEAEQDKNITFHQKLNQIWNDDFNGYENIPYLEKEREKAVNKQISERHLKILKSYFKFPILIGTITLLVLFSIIANYISPKFFVLVYGFCAFAPLIIYIWNYRKLRGYQSGNKVSIKKNIMNSKAMILGAIFNCFVFLPTFFDIKPSQVLSKIPIAIVIFLVVSFVIYALSYFKLYKETFKMELVK